MRHDSELDARASRARHVRRFVGGFYLTMGGINLGIVFADPETYRHFADAAYLDVVSRQWNDVVMANPAAWGVLLATGEILIGTLLLGGGVAARIGWIGAIVFHVLLMSFGPGIWLWCIPVLAVLIPVARADWAQLASTRDREDERVRPAR